MPIDDRNKDEGQTATGVHLLMQLAGIDAAPSFMANIASKAVAFTAGINLLLPGKDIAKVVQHHT